MSKFRLRVLLILFFGGCLMVGTRLFYLQVVQADHWKAYATQIRLSRRSTPTHRGRILAENLPSASDSKPVVLAADLPAFDIAVKLSELDEPEPELRRALYGALRVDGKRVRDRGEVELKLIQMPANWAMQMRFSGHVLQRQPPKGLLKLVWKGNYVKQPVSGEKLIDIPENIMPPVRNLSKLTGHSVQEILQVIVEFSEDMLNRRANSWNERPVIEDVNYRLVEITEIKKDELRGFKAGDKRVRCYPRGDMAGHIIGYMTKLNREEYEEYNREYAGSKAKRYFLNDSIGRSGVEARFNAALRGSRGSEIVEKDRHGRTVRELNHVDAVPGSDVYLTLLPAQQRAAELAFADRTGAAVVLDLTDGALLVLASNPRYAPDRFSSDYNQLVANPDKPLLHRAIMSYPLGSTFKLVTALAAWDSGVSSNAHFNCTGKFRIGGLRCAARWGHHNIGIRDAIKRSCNVYFCELGVKAGAEKISEWARKVGFGKNTPYELAGEQSGYVPSPSRRKYESGRGWWPGDTANYSIGQGALLVTPIQAARAMGLVCTNGRYVKPHLVKKIVDADGNLVAVPGRESIEPEYVQLTPGATDRFLDGLTAVAHEPGGTADDAFADWKKPYKIAGKTSTAERGRGKSDLGWFVGVAPANEPKIAFAVNVDLKSGEHGGHAAAPIARKIIESFPDEFFTGGR